jgi:hypothetical protein
MVPQKYNLFFIDNTFLKNMLKSPFFFRVNQYVKELAFSCAYGFAGLASYLLSLIS